MNFSIVISCHILFRLVYQCSDRYVDLHHPNLARILTFASLGRDIGLLHLQCGDGMLGLRVHDLLLDPWNLDDIVSICVAYARRCELRFDLAPALSRALRQRRVRDH